MLRWIAKQLPSREADAAAAEVCEKKAAAIEEVKLTYLGAVQAMNQALDEHQSFEYSGLSGKKITKELSDGLALI